MPSHLVTRVVILVAVSMLAIGALDSHAASADGEDFEPRILPVKPDHSTVHPGYDETHVMVKFLDDLDIAVSSSGFIIDRSGRTLTSNETRVALSSVTSSGGSWSRMTSDELAFDRMRSTAENNLNRGVADLNNYFVLAVPPDSNTEELLDRLNAIPEVEIALPVPLAVAPPTPPDFQLAQGYQYPAPDGIDTPFAWNLPGGTGSNVVIVDLEYSWNLNHQDLPSNITELVPIGSIQSDPFDDNNHGTAVLGEMVRLNNGWGTTGAAYGATVAVAPTSLDGLWRFDLAMSNALLQLSPGDIILIEQQTVGPNYTGQQGQKGLVPVEWFKPFYDVIVTAVGNGIHVVEAAGNGTQNLDAPEFSTGNAGHWPFLPGNDSGAIIVGAGYPPPLFSGIDISRARLGFSNYGSRLNVQAWGSGVTTTGYGDLYSSEGVNLLYTFGFSGTSSASPIVTSAVALIESIYEEMAGGVVAPVLMRSILANTGTAQQSGSNPISERIGSLPNIPAALATLFGWNADVAIAKTRTPASVVSGDQIAYTLDVINNGTSTAHGVIVTDALPHTLSLISATSSQGTCMTTLHTISCNAGELINGASATVSIITKLSTSTDTVLDTTINGVNLGEESGSGVDTGDINNDGVADLIIGAYQASPGGRASAGETRVIFGPIDTGTIQSSAKVDITFYGIDAGDYSGDGVASGDINNDRIDDLIIGALGASPGDRTSAGETYVIFGPLNSGKYEITSSGDELGIDLASGDVINNDAIDLIIGVWGADPNGKDIAGQAYVISGPLNSGTYEASTITDLIIDGLAPSDLLGVAVDSGDVNNDGVDDILVGALLADPDGRANAGETYVYFGRPEVTGITNTAQITAYEIDPNPANNSSTATTTVTKTADLAVSKTVSSASTLLDNTLIYTITVTNNGPSTSTNVIAPDTLPAGAGHISSSFSQGNCSGTETVICNFGTINAFASATVTIVIKALNTGSLVNSAVVAASETDPDSSNNTASATTTVNPVANLSITKSASPEPVLLGNNVTYTLVVTNAGPSIATDVAVTDNLPPNVSLVSTNVSQGSACSGFENVTCNLGTIGVGATATASLIVRADGLGTFTNQARATSSVTDLESSNNTASATTTVVPAADLTISKFATPNPALVGMPLTYTVNVTNLGPSTTTDVVLADILPSSVSIISTSTTKGTCSGLTTLTCNIGTLIFGASSTLTIVVIPTASGTVANSASVTGSESDPNASNNSTTTTTTVNQATVDLAVTKTETPDPVLAGQTVTYTITVTNIGPDASTPVTLTDSLPAGVTLVATSTSQGSCSGTITITCILGILDSGATSTTTIVIETGSPGTLVNIATVTSADFDTNPANNTATSSTAVSPTDLIITKSGPAEFVRQGDGITFTLTVTNIGSATATNVIISDNLPSEITYASSTPSGICSLTGEMVICNLGTLEVGASLTVLIHAVAGEFAGFFTNTATVSADNPESDSSNNSTSTVTEIPGLTGWSLAILWGFFALALVWLFQRSGFGTNRSRPPTKR